MNETLAVYDEIKSQLVDGTMLNETIGSSMGTVESQLSHDMGDRLLAMSKKIPSIFTSGGKDDTEYVREGEIDFVLD